MATRAALLLGGVIRGGFMVPMRARICVGAAHDRRLWPDDGSCILATMNGSRKPRVAIVFTGGTISMRLDPVAGGAVPVLSGDEILAQVPGLEQIAEVTTTDFRFRDGINT